MAKRTQRKYPTVFGWSSPFNMLCKLGAELERVDQAETLHDLIQHSMNFAFTAFHLIDWVWELLQRTPESKWDTIERNDWIAAIGFTPNSKLEVTTWALQQCPELAYCRELANATKHLSCTLEADAPVSEFRVSAASSYERSGTLSPFMRVLDQHLSKNHTLKLIVGEQNLDIVEVFRNKVSLFWSELSNRIYIYGNLD